MCNHHRGLWGYTGTTADDRELTIQSTGVGGPSAAIVLAELARHGVRRAIRIGTCTAIDGRPPLGSAIAASSAVGDEGSCRALGFDGVAGPDPELHARLVLEAGDAATETAVRSVDVVSAAPGLEGPTGLAPRRDGEPSGGRAPVVDMGTATLFALGTRLGVAVASVLVVARAQPDGEGVDDAALERVSLKLGNLAARALRG